MIKVSGREKNIESKKINCKAERGTQREIEIEVKVDRDNFPYNFSTTSNTLLCKETAKTATTTTAANLHLLCVKNYDSSSKQQPTASNNNLRQEQINFSIFPTSAFSNHVC